MKPFLAPTKCNTSITGLLVAMAARVAKVTQSTVAAIISNRMPTPAATAVLVECRTRHLLGQYPAKLRNVRRRSAGDLYHNQPWYRQCGEREAVTEPRLQELGGFLFRIGAYPANAGEGAGRGSRPLHRGVNVATGCRGHLDGDLTRNVRLPFARSVANQYHGTGGDGGEERHDGDDGNQRAPGDRIARHQWRLETRQSASRQTRR